MICLPYAIMRDYGTYTLLNLLRRLHGVTLAQTVYYYRNYPLDRQWYRIMVSALLLMFLLNIT